MRDKAEQAREAEKKAMKQELMDIEVWYSTVRYGTAVLYGTVGGYQADTRAAAAAVSGQLWQRTFCGGGSSCVVECASFVGGKSA